MHKLVILIEGTELPTDFDENWPQFLHLAEQMPGLQREATSRVHHILFGKQNYVLIHELFFDSLEALQEAMTSKAGQQAGQVLQKMTLGKLMLMVSDHNEDDMENIRRYAKQQADAPDVESEN